MKLMQGGASLELDVDILHVKSYPQAFNLYFCDCN
jgi:hypothetical protein